MTVNSSLNTSPRFGLIRFFSPDVRSGSGTNVTSFSHPILVLQSRENTPPDSREPNFSIKVRDGMFLAL